MTALEQASSERIEQFKQSVFSYKRETGSTYEQIAEECELSTNALYNFLSRRKIPALTVALKISMSLGIEF